MTTTPQVNVPVFAGQGTAATYSLQTMEQALRDASSPSGFLLLCACHEAINTELSSLSSEELQHTGLSVADFRTRDTLLAIPPSHLSPNPVISGTRLCLLQSLRYLAFVEASNPSPDSFPSFNKVLESNSGHRIGILSFSSGVLPACVVSASFSTLSFITWAIEAYRLAFWIGIRCQIHRATSLRERGLPGKSSLPWSRVFVGLNEYTAREAISAFLNDEDSHGSSLCVTAVIDDDCVTVSGFPDILERFSANLRASVAVHDTVVDALYHSPIHTTTRLQVLSDVSRRQIRFPDFSDIKIPIRSPFTGRLIENHTESSHLVEEVVDMLLIQPVNWNIVISEVLTSHQDRDSLSFVNVGPGTGLIRCMEKVLLGRNIAILDLTAPDPNAARSISPMQEPIAIIGMAVNMPGAQNTQKLWEVLEKGINTVAQIPEQRFKVSDYEDPKYAKPGRAMKACTGNFIDGVDEFDHTFFRISPREAKSMDPQQRVLLQTAYEALENSGYVPNDTPSFQQQTFGCYIGAATHDYLQNLRDNIDVYYSTGTLKAFLSGRISYAMQLGGPSVVVDTACSSSSAAIYQGCRALVNGDCNAALVGGVNVITSPDMFIGLDRAHLLSPTGQCKPFDTSADGYSRSDGCGIFVLKRLSDARSENDNILGLIRGVEMNQSGQAQSITHPHFPTQTALFRRLLERTGIEPCRVNVIEAHGTGTTVGDPIEVASVRSVFGVNRTANNPLYIMSVKGNIGHLEAASGAAGLAKLLLMLHHRMIPRQISFRHLNPHIASLEFDHTIIPTRHTAWTPSHDGKTRMALLNSFGAAGSNTAILLEEYISSRRQTSEHHKTPHVFGLSAKTEIALEELRLRFLHWLRSPAGESVPLLDLAYTMTARRQVYPYRLAVSANDRSTLVDKLNKAPMVHTPNQPGGVAFVFSGQGSQYLGMGRSLYQTSPLFKHHINECHFILTALGFPGVLSIITADSNDYALSLQEQFEANQAAIVALEYSLAKLWISWGVYPVVVIGHSLGEFAALVIADVLTLKHSLTLVATRARLMVTHCIPNVTGMMAVNAEPAVVERELKSSETFAGLSIACFNSPVDCVVAGPLEELRAFKVRLDHGVRCQNTFVSVPFGYHSSAMTPLLSEFTLAAQKIAFRPPTIHTVSTVLGVLVRPGDDSVFNAGYFARHCSGPVLFETGIRSLISRPDFETIHAWIDIGPHPTSLAMLKAQPSLFDNVLLLPSLRKCQDPWVTLVSSLAQLYLSITSIRWREVFAHLFPVCSSMLPSYPFVKTKFWVPFREDEVTAIPPVLPSTDYITDYSMLYSWVQYPSSSNGHVSIFQTPISHLSDAIQGHRVGGVALCPVSVYLEQILAGIDLSRRYLPFSHDDRHVVLRGTEFIKPLVYDEGVECTVMTTVTLNGDFGVFSVSSQTPSLAEDVVHVQGNLTFQSASKTGSKFSRKLPALSRQISTMVNGNKDPPEVFSMRTAYEIIFPRVVDYSERYHTMQSITVDSSGMEGYAIVKLPSNYDKGKYVVHPVFMDTLIHVAGFVANLHGGANDAYICNEVASVKVIPELVNNDGKYGVYCSNAWLQDEGVMLAEAFAIQLVDPRKIVAHLKGMHFRRVPHDSFKRRLATASSRSSSTSPVSRYSSPGMFIYDEKLLERGALSICDEPDAKRILASVLHVQPQDLDEDAGVQALGLDSLSSIEALRALKNESGLDLPRNLFFQCPTIRAVQSYLSSRRPICQNAKSSPLAALVESRHATSTPQLHPFPVPIQRSVNSHRSPLFLFHDGSGLINYYDRLPFLDRNIWGIPNPNFLTGKPWSDLPSMAVSYAQQIMTTLSDPVILGGWSFGGIVAFEAARYLLSNGIRVKGVVLIDSPSPVKHTPLSDVLIDFMLNLGRNAYSEIGERIKAQFRMNSHILGNYDPHSNKGPFPHLAFLRASEDFRPMDVPDIPLWLADRRDRDQVIAGWECLVGNPLKIWAIPGHHFQPFDACNITKVSQCIDEACRYLETL